MKCSFDVPVCSLVIPIFSSFFVYLDASQNFCVLCFFFLSPFFRSDRSFFLTVILLCILFSLSDFVFCILFLVCFPDSVSSPLFACFLFFYFVFVVSCLKFFFLSLSLGFFRQLRMGLNSTFSWTLTSFVWKLGVFVWDDTDVCLATGGLCQTCFSLHCRSFGRVLSIAWHVLLSLLFPRNTCINTFIHFFLHFSSFFQKFFDNLRHSNANHTSVVFLWLWFCFELLLLFPSELYFQDKNCFLFPPKVYKNLKCYRTKLHI